MLDTARTATFDRSGGTSANPNAALAEAIAVADADLLDIGVAPAIMIGGSLLLRARDSVAVRTWLVNALTRPVP